jgi:hypothetical protein
MNARALWLGLVLIGGLGSACKSNAPAMTAGGAGVGVSGAGSGGTLAASGAGATAAGGTTGSAGMGAAGASASVTCGTATCTAAPPNPGLSATPPQACCSDAAQNLCGSMLSGTCNPPLPLAPKCMLAFTTSRPCCITATNTCGVDASAYGKGCLDVSATMAGKKTLCDGTEVQPGGAAGSSAGAGAAGSTSAAGNGGHGGAGAAGH